MPVTRENVGSVFSYHAPEPPMLEGLTEVRESARGTAETILSYCPPCADREAALRGLRLAVMQANAAIVLKGVV